MGRFDFGPDHPFKPERAIKTHELCSRYGVMDHPWIRQLKPDALDPDLLRLFHEPLYLELLKEASRGRVSLEMLEHGLGSEDTPILQGIFEWSLRAAGGTHAVMRYILDDEALVGFNPLGGFHHAMPGNAEGFCYINDIVIAIRDALLKSPELRVAYIDLDAHHGNGVQHAFYEESNVFVLSIHETGRNLYPWSGYANEMGEGEGKGFTVNLPLEPGADDGICELMLDELLFPLLRKFSPDIVVAELGADGLVSDPLTHLKLTNNVYQKAIRGIIEICPRILGLGGGGYDLFKTARCWTLVWSILNHLEPEDEFAGLVGGMMFGPEMEMGSLYDSPYQSAGEEKDVALKSARNVIDYIKKNLFPIHGIG